MSEKLKNQGIALAALVQSANLVDRLASHGQVPDSSLNIMRDSLFRFDIKNVEDIYTNERDKDIRQNLHTGIRVSRKIFLENANLEYGQTIRYVLALIQLEKHFRHSNELTNKVRTRLESISDQTNDESISQLYLETLATLPFRIQVLGKMQHLKNPKNEYQIRTLLFSGLRAAMLWHQMGGRRWHFIFRKKAIITSLEQLA